MLKVVFENFWWKIAALLLATVVLADSNQYTADAIEGYVVETGPNTDETVVGDALNGAPS